MARARSRGLPTTEHGVPATVTVDRAAGAAPHALGHPLDDVVEGDDLLGLVVVGVGGELHELVDERAELTGLDLEVGEDGLAGGLGQVVVAAQGLDVGAQAGERGAQLVAGVLHQLLLLLARLAEGGEHRGEGAGEATGLVAAGRRHVDVEAAAAGDLLGGVGELHERLGGLAGDQPAGEGAEAADHHDDDADPEAQGVEHPLGLAEVAGQLHGADAVEGVRRSARS